ncbi:hypothetical protein NP233_g7050 [Leucocoprinus birnbaumii]|uniref:Uncharacterized protein n=1 Tax=Leucocoprinus birnbaumii TaxID=56174 RepID=A0AAD5VSB1_9AGAR|nr:hypothetical protein NP233_g7050 [Leucocoprinus birnbaumii]
MDQQDILRIAPPPEPQFYSLGCPRPPPSITLSTQSGVLPAQHVGYETPLPVTHKSVIQSSPGLAPPPLSPHILYSSAPICAFTPSRQYNTSHTAYVPHQDTYTHQLQTHAHVLQESHNRLWDSSELWQAMSSQPLQFPHPTTPQLPSPHHGTGAWTPVPNPTLPVPDVWVPQISLAQNPADGHINGLGPEAMALPPHVHGGGRFWVPVMIY